jgi:hypothetical protein
MRVVAAAAAAAALSSPLVVVVVVFVVFPFVDARTASSARTILLPGRR